MPALSFSNLPRVPDHMPRGRQETAGQSAWHESHMACRPGKTPQTSPNHPEETLCPTICYVFYIFFCWYCIVLMQSNISGGAVSEWVQQMQQVQYSTAPWLCISAFFLPVTFGLDPSASVRQVGHLAGICVYWYNYVYTSHMQVCHFAQRGKLPCMHMYVIIYIIYNSHSFIMFHFMTCPTWWVELFNLMQSWWNVDGYFTVAS